MPARRTAEAPASMASQADSSAAPGAADGERKGFISVMRFLKETRDELGTRPSNSQVQEATSAVSSIVSEVEKEIETLASTPSPSEDSETAFALKAFKEDVARTRAQMKLLPAVSVLELDKKFRHYDAVISAAETALLTGKWKNEHGRADWLNVLTSPDKDTSLSLPAPIVAISFPQVFSPRGNMQNGHVSPSPLLSNPPHAFAPPMANVMPLVMASPSPTEPMRASMSEYTARTGETAHATSLVSQLSTPPQFFARAATLNEKPHKDPSVTLQTSFDDHHDAFVSGLYSPGSASGGRAAGFALQPSRLSSAKSGVPEESPVVVDPVLLRIIQDSVQGKPRTLDIRGHLFSQPLQVIPETLGFVDSLVELNVSENTLVILPDSLGSLKKLQQLDVSCNQLLELPRSIGELKELKELDLHHNKLDELPVALGSCEALEILHVEFNLLKSFPKSLGNLKSLRVLTAHLNQLVTIPMTLGQCESLVELDVHMNQLSGMPESIGRLKNLEKLNISANHFALQVLPFSLGQLVRLRELDLRENHIKVLPSSVSQLTNLKALKLEGNPWKQPPYAVTQQGMKAVMDYLAQSKDGSYSRGEGSVGGGGVLKKGGGFNIFKMLHKKGEDQEKLDSWKSHANTWGA